MTTKQSKNSDLMNDANDPEFRAKMFAVYRVIRFCDTATKVLLGVCAYCLLTFVVFDFNVYAGAGCVAAALGALYADHLGKKARQVWDANCPCPGCVARRAAEKKAGK